jgi:hypothetical protein
LIQGLIYPGGDNYVINIGSILWLNYVPYLARTVKLETLQNKYFYILNKKFVFGIDQYVFLTFLWFLWLAFSCGETTPNSGKYLMTQYCSSCHLTPQPEDLDKVTWKKVILPRMASFMGLDDSLKAVMLADPINGPRLKEISFFPEKPLVSQKEWEELEAYILARAPESLELPKASFLSEKTPFKVKIPDYYLSPSTTLAQINTEGKIMIADANTQKLYQFNEDLQVEKVATIKEGGVGLIETDNEWIVTVMGSFSPTEEASGFVMGLPASPGLVPRIFIDSLRRPVDTQLGDINGDGRMDFLVAEFARYSGKLAWYEQLQNGSFQTRVLAPRTGAIKSYLRDIEGDGDWDIIALFGQGDEGIVQFTNDGNGNFSAQNLLRFPPSYGSSYFTLQNLDADPEEEMLYVCGDNADYPGVLKPYHGIYRFDQQEDGEWKQTWFHHLNGAYKAIAEDFDLDGDLDIAAISFFPDYENNQEEGLQILINQGDFTFATTTVKTSHLGRWITMDAGDIDRDGDVDLVLGSLAFEVPEKPEMTQMWMEKGIPFILLENFTQ